MGKIKKKKKDMASGMNNTDDSLAIGDSTADVTVFGDCPSNQPIANEQSQEDALQVFDNLSKRGDESEPDKSCTLGDDDTKSKIDVVTHAKLVGESKKKKEWADLLKPTNQHVEKLCKLITDEQSDNAILLEYSDIQHAGFSLVGYVVGKFPGKKVLLQCCYEWGVRFQYASHESKWLVFKFEAEDDRRKVLNEGPYFIFNKQLILKEMPPFFDFSDDDLYKIPIWVQVRNLPLELWSSLALSKILSKIGRPLRTDARTAARTVVSFARALVEIDVSKVLLKELHVKIPNGMMFKLALDYENVPDFCYNCNYIGHKTSRCGQNKAVNTQPEVVGGKAHNEKGVKSDGGTVLVTQLEVATDDAGANPSPEGKAWRQQHEATIANSSK